MRYPVFVAATVALSVSLASVLTAWLIVATKGVKPRVQPKVALVGGGARMPVIFLGSPTQGAHLPLPPTTHFIPTRTAAAVMRVKWLSAFGTGSGHVLIVQPGVHPSTLARFLSCPGGRGREDIVYMPQPATNLFAQVTGSKHRRVKQWSAFLRENVHPAWWPSLLCPDTRILLRRASPAHMTPACRDKCTTMLKFMREYKLWNDTFMFGYFFSPLESAIAPICLGNLDVNT